jgi:hypothetical protein
MQVLQLAKTICTAVSSCLFGELLCARIRPYEESLDVSFIYAQDVCFYLSLSFDGECTFDDAYLWSEDRLPGGSFVECTVPDAPEALHLVGIILDALNPELIEVGALSQERNQFIWQATPDGCRDQAPIDRCDHVLIDTCGRRAESETPWPMLAAYSVFTTVEFFNRAARAVNEVRKSMGDVDLFASFWGCRIHQPASHTATMVGPQRPARTSHALALDFRNGHGKVHRVNFLLADGCDLRTPIVRVPNLMYAVHMAGMIIATIGARIESIGNRHLETNSEAHHRPLPPGVVEGQMVSAFNFVVPLAPTPN